MKYTKEVLIKLATFSSEELAWIQSRRRKHNQLGFAYQLAYVKLHNRFPVKEPLKLSDQLLRFVSIQLEIKPGSIKAYKQREATVLEHQNQIRSFLGLFRFGEAFSEEIRSFIFEKACQLEQTHALLSLLRDYLRKQAILEPAESSLRRIIHQQRQKAREFIFDKIFQALSPENKDELDKLLQTESNSYSPLQHLKQTSSRASAKAIISICEKLDQIDASGVLAVDLSWLNNNLQRWMNRYVRKATAFRLRELTEKKRYSMLLCFLKQHHRDLTDDLVRTYEKVISQMYSRTQSDLDTHQRRNRKTIRASLISFQTMVDCLLDESIKDRLLRTNIFEQIERAKLSSQREQVDDWLNGKHKDTFTLLVNTRFSYLRQFSPALIEHLSIEKEDSKDLKLIESVELIREMNALGKRKLPSELPIPMDFIPKSMQELVLNSQGEIDKPAWECALLTKLKDHIKSGNIAIKNSKRYGHLDDFFMPEHLWESRRNDFFHRAGLPKDSSEVKSFLSKRLDSAFDQFLEKLPHNNYAQLDQSGWKMSKDESVEMNVQDKDKLEKIEKYLARHMRMIKLPQLLIEVDNELHFSKYFMNPAKQRTPDTQDICAIMATVMAHGCNMGVRQNSLSRLRFD